MWARASSGRSSTRRRQKRDCRHPVSAITPSEWRLQQLHVDVRLPAREALEEARRAQLDQIAQAGLVLGQQRQVVALVAHLLGDLAAIVDEIGLHAEDRLDAVRAARVVHLHRPVHHPVVGQSQGRHPELGGALRHPLDLARSVEQRVLAVHMEVNGLLGAHASQATRGCRRSGGGGAAQSGACATRITPQASLERSAAPYPTPGAKHALPDSVVRELSRDRRRAREGTYPAQTQALPPESAQICCATSCCSCGDASWGAPSPPYDSQVEGRI